MLWVVVLSSGIEAKADLRAVEAYSRGIKMLFTENVGQLSNEVVFYSMHPSVVYILRDGSIHINGVRVSFGVKPRFITGDMPLITKISYFGRNRSISDIPTYRRVVLKEVYPKIDAILTADGRGVVEFQFVVHPGGDPSRIKVETDGRVVQREDGIYIVKEGKELVKISDLKAYQGAEEVEVRAEVKGKEVRFSVDNWDRKHTLVIDPVATAILASSWRDEALSIAIDSSGNVFVAGWTYNSSDFAPSRNVFGTAGYEDAFVSKLSSDLSVHIATAILASSDWDFASSIAIDGSGSVFVAGLTGYSSDFAPSRNVFGITGGDDAFVSKLSNDLSVHIATAILASSSSDAAYSIAIDGSGNVFVAGETWRASDFAPSRNVFGTTGGDDAFVSKLSNDLSAHIATAILTSSSSDYASSIAIDGSGSVFVAGGTWNSSDFAPSRNVFGITGWGDVFVSKLSSDLSAHIATAILTSSSDDYASSIAIDNSGSVFVAGETWNSSDFAPSRNIFGTPSASGSNDTAAFVSKLSSDLSAHIATAILTSSSYDYASSIAMDDSGSVFVAGRTGNSSDFAPSRNVFGTTGGDDAFVSKLSNDLSAHIATAILTSSSYDGARSVAIDNSGSVFVAGGTWNSSDFAPSRNVFGITGSKDVFVSRLPAALNVSEKAEVSRDAYVEISGDALILTLPTSAYVGFDVYSADGRLIGRVSLGYLPAGKYEYRLKLPRGVYLLKVRVGDEVREIKGVL